MEKLIRRYYGFQFFFSLLLWLPIFYEYQKRIGLNDTQIFGIQSVYYTVFCFLEIPTGVLADLWGHRACLRLGAFVLVAANLLPVASPGYSGFLAHFLLIAASRSLVSGAASAYLYNALLASGADRGMYKKVEGNARAYGLAGKVLLWPLMGPLMVWRLRAPYVLTALSAAVSVVYAARLPEDAIPEGSAANRRSGRKATQFFTDIGPVISGLVRSPMLGLIMLQGLGVFVLSRICQVNLFQPILDSKSFGISSYGLWMAVATIFEAAGSTYPIMQAVLRKFSELNAVFVLTAALGICFAVISISGPMGTVASLVAFSLATGMSFPIQKQLLNDAITAAGSIEKYRATLLSVESIVDRAVCAWVVTWIGVYVARGRIGEFLQLSAIGCWAVTLVLFVAIRWAIRWTIRRSVRRGAKRPAVVTVSTEI